MPGDTRQTHPSRVMYEAAVRLRRVGKRWRMSSGHALCKVRRGRREWHPGVRARSSLRKEPVCQSGVGEWTSNRREYEVASEVTARQP